MTFGKVGGGSGFRIQPGVPTNRAPGEFEPIQRTFENIQHLSLASPAV